MDQEPHPVILPILPADCYAIIWSHLLKWKPRYRRELDGAFYEQDVRLTDLLELRTASRIFNDGFLIVHGWHLIGIGLLAESTARRQYVDDMNACPLNGDWEIIRSFSGQSSLRVGFLRFDNVEEGKDFLRDLQDARRASEQRQKHILDTLLPAANAKAVAVHGSAPVVPPPKTCTTQ